MKPLLEGDMLCSLLDEFDLFLLFVLMHLIEKAQSIQLHVYDVCQDRQYQRRHTCMDWGDMGLEDRQRLSAGGCPEPNFPLD